MIRCDASREQVGVDVDGVDWRSISLGRVGDEDGPERHRLPEFERIWLAREVELDLGKLTVSERTS
jgi:hypothetical protein